MLITGVFHTGFTVSNLERSLEFYCGLLGLEVVAQQLGDAPYLSRLVGFPDAKIKTAFIKPKGVDHILELLEYASHPGEPTPRETNRPGNGHICFYVDDIWAWYHELVAKGVKFTSPEPVTVTAGVNRGAMSCYLRDPDGFTVEIFQKPPRPAAASATD